MLHKQNYDWVFPVNQSEKENGADHTPPLVIRRWSQPVREKYANNTNWHIDRRAKVRALFGNWMIALIKARDLAIKGK